MSLADGMKLGPYEISAPLGAGGPASAHGPIMNALRRGLAEAQRRWRW
jgi:hypothetical protein